MPAKRAKALFTEFFATAISDYKFSTASFGITDGNVETVQRFESLLSAIAGNGHFAGLTQEQFDLCLNEIVREEALASGRTSSFILLQAFEISKWRIHGQLPCISTFLQFETVEQFQEIKRVPKNLHFCKLNEKHLKPVRTKAKKPTSQSKAKG
jgi:hypothetical protein